jgi:EpsD family peptidyl-prolyl cis-trans isomerase
MTRYRICLVPLLLAVVCGAGCGKSEDKKKPATQVAAKVNADEITVHQVNSVLARTPNLAPEAAARAKTEILDRLVEQQLARQKAIEKKLDQSPGVVQAMEAAKSEILARAYLEQVAAVQPKPSPEDVKKYYAEHPELFAQRRLFSLEEISLVANDEVAAGLRERAAKGRSMREIGEWLQSQGIKFAPNRGVRAAEQLPLEILPKMQAMKNGEIQVHDAGGGRFQVIRVVESKADPVDEAAAAPRIQQFLFNRRSSEAIATEMKQVRAGAKIEYVGEFAGGAAAAAAKAKAEADAKAKALSDAKKTAEAEARVRAEELSKARAAAEAKARLDAALKAEAVPSKPVQLPQQSFEKGVKGLK